MKGSKIFDIKITLKGVPKDPREISQLRKFFEDNQDKGYEFKGIENIEEEPKREEKKPKIQLEHEKKAPIKRGPGVGPYRGQVW